MTGSLIFEVRAGVIESGCGIRALLIFEIANEGRVIVVRIIWSSE